MSVKIKKATIKDGLFLEAEYEEFVGEITNKVKKNSRAPIHDDLRNAFKKLDYHLTKLGDQYNNEGELDIEHVGCTGFTIGGSGDHEGVTLFGGRILDGDKYLNIVAPFTKWESVYNEISELGEIIEECKSEVDAYLFQGKHKPQMVQVEIDFEDDDMDMEG